jgi:hypothetical protein
MLVRDAARLALPSKQTQRYSTHCWHATEKAEMIAPAHDFVGAFAKGLAEGKKGKVEAHVSGLGRAMVGQPGPSYPTSLVAYYQLSARASGFSCKLDSVFTLSTTSCPPCLLVSRRPTSDEGTDCIVLWPLWAPRTIDRCNNSKWKEAYWKPASISWRSEAVGSSEGSGNAKWTL